MLFAENEKLIFGYDLGGKRRHVDPLAMRRRLVRAANGELNQMIRAVNAEPADDDPMGQVAKAEAEERLGACVREAFDMPAVDPDTGDGVPEVEVTRVLREFLGWLEKN